MKHLKHLFTALLLLCSTVATAYDFVVNGIYYNITDAVNKTVEVTYFGNSYEDTSGMVIPKSVTHNGTTYSVTSIGQYAFKDCDDLESIIIPNGVTSIGYQAFCFCSSLTSVTIPYSVTSIGTDAFYDCSDLKTVKNLSNLTFTKGSRDYGYVAYYANKVITGTKIDDYIFSTADGKNKLIGYAGNDENLSLPESFNGNTYSIAADAFENCGTILSITIPAKVEGFEGIEGRTFYNTDVIKVFWLTNTPPAGYELLGGKINYVSNELYTKLTGEVVVSKFLSSKFEIGGIQYIPTSVADRRCCVVDYAASSKLSSIVVSDSVSYSGVQFEVCDIMPYAFYDNDTAGSLTLKNCGNIGTSAFEDCGSLTSVVISKSITSVSDFAFKGCAALVNASFSDRETILPLGRRLFDDTKLDYLYIGSKISYINEASYETSPFCNNKTLRSLVITDVENEIYDYEFYGCSNLQTAVVGDGVEKIGRWAFSGCGSLQEFVFGSNVSSIGEEAFSDCVNVTKITGRAILPPVCGAQALDDINKFNCTLYVPSRNLSEYQAADQWKEFPFTENLVTNDNYVTYMIDGEVYKTLLLTPGKRIIAPYVPDKDGVPFDGWDMEEFMTIPNPAPEFGLNERVPIMPDRDIVIYGYYKSYEVTGITLDRTAITVQEGDNVTLTATVSPDNATDKTVTWSSSNTNVATVYNGVVVAVAPGTAVITAQAGGHTANCIVTVDVNDTAVEEVTVEEIDIVVYDLNGNRIIDVENIESGVYIINGKKILVK